MDMQVTSVGICTIFLMISQSTTNGFQVLGGPGTVHVPIGGTFKAVWTLRGVDQHNAVTIHSPRKGRMVSFMYGHQHPVVFEVGQTHFTYYGDARSTFGVIVTDIQLKDMGEYSISQVSSDISITKGSTCTLVVYERLTIEPIILYSLIVDATDKPMPSDPSYNYRSASAVSVTGTTVVQLRADTPFAVPMDIALSITAIALTLVLLGAVIVIYKKLRPDASQTSDYDENQSRVSVRTMNSISDSASDFDYDDIRITTRPRISAEEDDHSYEKPDPPPDTEYEKPYQFVVHAAEHSSSNSDSSVSNNDSV